MVDAVTPTAECPAGQLTEIDFWGALFSTEVADTVTGAVAAEAGTAPTKMAVIAATDTPIARWFTTGLVRQIGPLTSLHIDDLRHDLDLTMLARGRNEARQALGLAPTT